MVTRLDPHANFWVEHDGKVVLSSWRVELLRNIESTGSISAAAEKMHIQYRRAWEKLEEMERGLTVALVDRQVGGVGGGGARLTDAGRDYVERFERFAAGVKEVVLEQFAAAFDDMK